MREIKFRAFRKKTKRMYQFDEVELITNDGYIEVHKKYLTKENIKGLFPKNFELMQFTGLKDKNGKEIYEGDIVGNKEELANFLVEFSDGCFWAIEITALKEKPTYLIGTDDQWEVIGNIYENPELLKEKK